MTTKADLLARIAEIQFMERGKLSPYTFKGRAAAADPYFKLQHWEQGKNLTRYIRSEQVPLVEEALEGHAKFRELVEQYAQLVIEQTRQQIEKVGVKKKAGPPPQLLLAQEQEIQELMVHFTAQEPTGVAVQELEVLVRTALFKPAAQLVGWMLQQAADRIDAQYDPQPGQVRKGRESVRVQGIFGTFELSRDYYYHPGKRQGHYPADAALGLEVGYTPTLARLICLEGADQASYRQAQEHLDQTGGMEVSARQIQRVVQRVGQGAQLWQGRESRPGSCAAPIMYISADGTGVPMRQEELEGRVGKGAEGIAKTRQAYLGCVFTQTRRDEKGHPVRDWESTSYVSSMAGIADFGPQLRREALRRGLGSVDQSVLLIDGANGLEHMGRDCFGQSVQIVDFYHAMEHGAEVLKVLLGSKEHEQFKPRHRRWARRLLRNGVEGLIRDTRQEAAALGCSEAVEEQLGYFVNNVQRMQYGTFRKKGYFIGSGVVEAGCKTVIGSRCKQSGMFWGRPGAEHVLALRCIRASRNLSAFWKHRLNESAAQNDSLPLAA